MIRLLLLVLVLTSCGPTTYRSKYAQPPEPVLAAVVKKPLTITIDPGHGGKDEGAHGKKPAYQEKQLTLATSRYLKKYLEGMGFRTIMTRGDDTFVPLSVRSAVANGNESDLFVSVHYNAAGAKSAQGVEVFYFNSEQEPQRSKDSKVLADMVLGKILLQTKAKSRGVKHGNLAVVRETKMPAILVEGGFLTNESERAKLLTEDYSKRLAWGMAVGIRDYLKK